MRADHMTLSDRIKGFPVPLKKTLRGILVGLLGALLALVLWLSGFLDIFEAKTWDWRHRLLAEAGRASDEIALILLDQNSLDWAGEEMALSWPWPRELYAPIIDFCGRAGVKSLAFDVLYLEPSTYGVYDDEIFGESIEDFGRFVGTVFLGRDTGDAREWPAEVPVPDLEIDGLELWLEGAGAQSLVFPRASFPIPEMALSAHSLANVQLRPDQDGIYRRGSLFQMFDGKAVPSMALAAYSAAKQEKTQVRVSAGTLSVDGYPIPIDSEGHAILRYRGPSGTHSAYSAAAIIQSELRLQDGEKPPVDPKELEGRHVLFGFTAPGLFDLRSSPVSGVYPGVEIHATMLDNLLSRDFMAEVPLGSTILLLLFVAFFAGVLGSLVSGGLQNTLLYAVVIALPPAAGLLVFNLGFWLPLVVMELAAVITLVGTGVVNYSTEGKQKRYIQGAFKQYLSPAVIEQLIAHPERLKLGGERRVLSIFFSDLEGFTSISEGLSPEELTSLLNEYLTAMTDIIQEEGGTVDKYEGDAIIAFWNAPLDLADHAPRAVRSALRCQQKLGQMRPAFRERIGKDMYMRIGLNTGPAVVGNMGSHNRFDYTMLGDAVNLAARLEGINKQFKTYTMISQATLDQCGGAFPVRELSRVAVVGRKEAVRVYEPMLQEEYEGKADLLPLFGEGLAAFYDGRFEEAQERFSGIADRDPPASCYLEKCRELAADPPAEWAGVWVMTSK